MVASNEVVYFMYAELLETGHMAIKTSEINRSTWQDHYDGIMNLMKDHIETEQLQSSFVTVDFGNGDIVELSVIDLYINLIMWYPLVSLNIPITGEHLYFNECETQDTIKNFFDDHKGADSFLWQSPFDGQIRVRAASYTLTPLGGEVWRVSTSFSQVFYP